MLDIRTGIPQQHQALTIVPLLSAHEVELPYLLLSDALTGGLVRITEVGGGTVPRLLAQNTGDNDVLILDGEQLIGARQNRMTGRSILLAAQSETEIPVSCMEHGRWRFVSEDFAPSVQHSPANVRRKSREVEAKAAAAGLAPSDSLLAEAQGPVWDEIGRVFENLSSTSPTSALDDAYKAAAPDLDAFLRAFPSIEGQVGLLGMVGDSVIGLDVIGGQSLFARLHERIVRGYVLDALATDRLPQSLDRAGGSGRDEEPAVCPPAAMRFLEDVRQADRVPAPTVGRGVYSVLTKTVIGGELVDDAMVPTRVVHLSAFPPVPARPPAWYGAGSPPIAPPSRRRG
jgi:hypothetical protein